MPREVLLPEPLPVLLPLRDVRLHSERLRPGGELRGGEAERAAALLHKSRPNLVLAIAVGVYIHRSQARPRLEANQPSKGHRTRTPEPHTCFPNESRQLDQGTPSSPCRGIQSFPSSR